MKNLHAVEVKRDDEGNLYIELPPDILQELGWDIGDDLLFKETDTDTIIITKVDDE
jgi:bifunctional DNA-binding transcriptional regulator/antitoxin component of YhaV-PrlF toxin-antitoxin module